MKNGHIVLCGFMGAGKSTVGPLIAKALGRTFVDMDELLAEELGKPITDMFKNEGEEAFRDAESALAKRLANDERELVIAAGGGMVLRDTNRRAFNTKGHHLVHLVVQPATVLQRVPDDGRRPLLDGPEREQKAERLLQARHASYAALPFQVYTDERGPEDVAQAVIRAIRMPE